MAYEMAYEIVSPVLFGANGILWYQGLVNKYNRFRSQINENVKFISVCLPNILHPRHVAIRSVLKQRYNNKK